MAEKNNWSKNTGEVQWQSPANIALIKYWGKYPEQLPMNPSLSFVLDKSVVRIRIIYEIKDSKPFKLLDFRLNGKEDNTFANRIGDYINKLTPYFPFLNHAHFKIFSESTFPHSAGIASSAAAFSALALCICSIDDEIHEKRTPGAAFYAKASFMARLGSGSACRSLYDGMVIWGKTHLFPETSDEYAWQLPADVVHESFRHMQDTILIADSQTKKVSSSAGHALMDTHPYRDQRKRQAANNLEKMTRAIKEGDWTTFGEIMENEALSLHGLMMSSSPGYILMHPNTLIMIDKIRAFREATGVPVYFTLDAGPNIHMIYPSSKSPQVHNFVKSDLAPLCEGNRWIDDAIGSGPMMPG